VSDRLWREWFAPVHAAPGAATLLVNGKFLTVVGAGPSGFRGMHQSQAVELWLPGNARRTAPDLAGVNGSYVGQLYARNGR